MKILIARYEKITKLILGSDGQGSVKKYSKRQSDMGMKIRTQDQLKSGWEYRLLINVNQEHAWRDDDTTLRVEALKGTNLNGAPCTKYATVVDFCHRQIWQVLTNNKSICPVLRSF